jgi:hypothetical protein
MWAFCFAAGWVVTVGTKRKSLLRTLIAMLLVAGVWGLDRWAPKPHVAVTLPPGAPTLLSVTSEIRGSFQDTETDLSNSPTTSPCTPKVDDLRSTLNSANPKRPALFAKPERLVIRMKSSSPVPPNTYDFLLEVGVTSRGEPSVAKDWSLCLVNQGQPIRYPPEEIMPADLSSFQNKTILEEASTNAPIKRGEAVVGWLLFRVPISVVNSYQLQGSIDCRDYLEHSYSMDFEIDSELPAEASKNRTKKPPPVASPRPAR